MIERFYQEPYELESPYEVDNFLRAYIDNIFPEEYASNIIEDLQRFSEKVVNIIHPFAENAMENEPELKNFDAWGNRVDEIITSDGWKELHKISASEGLIEIGYNREYEEYSRTYQALKLFLFTPSSAIYTCPLAMADGAARLIEEYAPDELEEPFNKLTSRDEDTFWVAGQWMTERPGGSDVSGTNTIAKKEGGTYRLYGDKWFTSAITADMAMTLARKEDESGETIPGSKGLSLFYVRIRDEDGKLNNIKINKLKDKLGTKALPTAELTLDGCEAIQIGKDGRGVPLISTILNITRIYNAISSISYIQRGLQLAKNYAHKREAFGKKLIDLPLHKQTLSEIEIEYIAGFALVFYIVELQGKIEIGKSSDEEERFLRLLTPVAKSFTAKQAVGCLSEIIETFGGMGYIEETGLPALLRDGQVFPIWEGTTNVLSLDTLRALHKDDSFTAMMSILQSQIKMHGEDFPEISETISTALTDLSEYAKQLGEKDRKYIETDARSFTFSIAKTVIATLFLRLYHQIEDEGVKKKLNVVLRRWCDQPLVDIIDADDDWQNENDTILS